VSSGITAASRFEQVLLLAIRAGQCLPFATSSVLIRLEHDFGT
jgi:hypothetical protein